MMSSVQNKKGGLTLNYLMLAIFTLAIVVQFNDPDSGVWIAVYSIAALVCLLASKDQLHWMLPALIGILVLTWAIVLFSQIDSKITFSDLFLSSWTMKTYAIELMREVGGLTVVLVWMIALSVSNSPILIKRVGYFKI